MWAFFFCKNEKPVLQPCLLEMSQHAILTICFKKRTPIIVSNTRPISWSVILVQTNYKKQKIIKFYGNFRQYT